MIPKSTQNSSQMRFMSEQEKKAEHLSIVPGGTSQPEIAQSQKKKKAPKRLPVPLTHSMRGDLDRRADERDTSLAEVAKCMMKRGLFITALAEEKQGQIIVQGSDGNPYYVVFED